MNKAFLVGRLTRDPELRKTPNDISVATMNIAITRRMNREESDFITVIAWRGLADNCGKYLVKGQQIAVAGEMRTRSYEDKDGARRYVTEVQAEDIEFLAKPNGGAGQEQGKREAQTANTDESDMFAQEIGGALVEDEGLPF